MPLVTTVGGTTSNSYADAAYALAYFAERAREEEWQVVVDEGFEDKFLLDAMLVIEAQDYVGIRVTDGQALEFPRIGRRRRRWTQEGYGLYDLRSRFWASNVIPPPVKDAQCEMALILYEDSGFLNQSGADVQTIRTGVVTLGAGGGSARAAKTPRLVLLTLDGFLLTGGNTTRLSKC